MPKEAFMRGFIRSLLLAACVWSGGVGVAQAVELQWWSHWAIEDSKKAVLFEAKRRFEQKNPGNTVTIPFYEKKNMWPALRAAFTAGSGFPDVFYYDMDVPEFMTAGWLADLSNGVRWENIEPFGKAFWTRPGAAGKTGIWAIPVEAASDEIYYNKKLFKQLGITVPAGFAFTQDQFRDVVGKCARAGYAAFATGASDREWAAHYIPNALLLDTLGADDFRRLAQGEISWKDPREGRRRVRRCRDRQHVDGQDRRANRDQDRPGEDRQSAQVVFRRVRPREQDHPVGRSHRSAGATADEAGPLGNLRRHGEPGPAQQAHRP